MITTEDLKILAGKNITAEAAQAQLDRFGKGFPFLEIRQAATPGKGIRVLSDEEIQQAEARWFAYLSNGGDVAKFVPASGAASRMFKALFEFADGNSDTPAENSDVDKFLKNISKLPFIDELEDTCRKLYGKPVASLTAEGRNRDVIAAIIRQEGMNYGGLPKGLLTFHKYEDGSTRTPLEEQIVEAAQTAATNGNAKLHFTVSAAHKDLFAKKIDDVINQLENKTGVKFCISMSEQKPSTDTIAANPDNTPFRDNDGKIVTRPGGHGALIENLNDLDSTVVFIKNIDNVVPDSLRRLTITYKKVLAGILIQAHDRIALYLNKLNNGNYTSDDLSQMMRFAQDTLCITPGKEFAGEEETAGWLKAKFNRPLRVCGMVRNEGEPGGGPYIAVNPDGTASPQILESTQIDTANSGYVSMMQKATHFNPVDLVCYIKDVCGNKFNLTGYTDPDTGFISSKSYQGRELKALELPGLWNGAMSNWNSIFVEVPAETFNPVKTVNDLLRPAHQTTHKQV